MILNLSSTIYRTVDTSPGTTDASGYRCRGSRSDSEAALKPMEKFKLIKPTTFTTACTVCSKYLAFNLRLSEVQGASKKCSKFSNNKSLFFFDGQSC